MLYQNLEFLFSAIISRHWETNKSNVSLDNAKTAINGVLWSYSSLPVCLFIRDQVLPFKIRFLLMCCHKWIDNTSNVSILSKGKR